MSVVPIDIMPANLELEHKTARDILNNDIAEIIEKEIRFCRLDNFPYKTNNPDSVLNHISRSIYLVTEDKGFSVSSRPNMGYRAFKFYVVREDNGQYIPYIAFDVEAYKKALNDLAKENNYHGIK